MSVAFGFEVTRSRRAAYLFAFGWTIPAVGLALAAVQLASGPTLLFQSEPTLQASLALPSVVGALFCATRAWRAARRTDGPGTAVLLSVDEAGAPSLAAGQGAPAVPAVLRATCALPGLILLVLSPSAPQASTVTVLSGRDGLSDDDWRRLNVWLRWMERGRHTLPSS